MSLASTRQAKQSVAAKAGPANVRQGSRLSSNRQQERKGFLDIGTSSAGSTVVFAVDMTSPHGGASRVNLPTCEAHAAGLSAQRCNSLGGMVRSTSRQGTSRCASGAGSVGAWVRQATAEAFRSKTSPDFSIACMMTASLRATATAARLKPIFSLSFRPQARKLLLACARVRTTVAAS